MHAKLLSIIIFTSVQTANGADIVGKVTLHGQPPPDMRVDLKQHAVLASKYPKGLTIRHYNTGLGAGLQNVLVYIHNDSHHVRPSGTPLTPILLNHLNGLFQPHIVGIQVGQPLHLKCSDEPSCSFLSFPRVNTAFSLSPGTNILPVTFTKAEPLPVRLKCDLHPWNYAYVGVFDNPYFAVTDEQGQYTIRNVPVGHYKLEAFHARAGVTNLLVTITENQTTINFSIAAK